MKISFIALGFIGLLSACAGDQSEATSQKTLYGGAFRYTENENFTTLYSLSITDYKTTQVANQIYEGLLKLDPKDLSIQPAIAQSWSVDESLTEYTFNLRKGVYFHDNDCFSGGNGREVNTQDFKYTFEKLCSNTPENYLFSKTFRDVVIGANELFNKKVDTLAGVKIIDNYTLSIKLTQPSNSFLYILTSVATSVQSKECADKYGIESKIGTGPFMVASPDLKGSELVLVRNKKYYLKDTLGNQLPYLDSVVVKFNSKKENELGMLRKGEIDAILSLPPESVVDVVEMNTTEIVGKNAKFNLERTPDMYTQFYSFNILNSALSKKKVRQAISYAIDRQKIFDEILLAKADAPGTLGLVPPAFKGYENPIGYSLDIVKAKKLLAEAGYPDGKGFPKLNLKVNQGASLHIKVADEIRKQLYTNLGININFEVAPFAQCLEDAKYAKGDIFRASWVADYPNPENFLALFYGKSVPKTTKEPSYPNTTRYSNPEFDALYEKGKKEPNTAEAYKAFVAAEKIAMEDAPLLILWYKESYRLTQSYVKNYSINPMEYMDLSRVYLAK